MLSRVTPHSWLWLSCLWCLTCSANQPFSSSPTTVDASAPDAVATVDSSVATDAEGSADAAANLIETPADEWTWLPIDGARCANGTSTGIGINRSLHSANLLITLEGGGACSDAATCFTTPAAVHLQDTYDATMFASDFASKTAATTRDPNNPLSLASAVFIPYCTGDLHAGDVVRNYDVNGAARMIHHVGGLNVDAALARLRAGLPEPAIVWVLGSSAGGYGATLNLPQIHAAFPNAQVHVLADCSPLLTPAGTRYSEWQAAWHMRMPAPCKDCTTQFGAVIDALATAYPSSRIGLLAFAQDAIVGQYFGYDGPSEQTALAALLSTSYQHPNTHAFIASGTMHTMLGNVNGTQASDGVQLSTWLVEWLFGLPSWQNTK